MSCTGAACGCGGAALTGSGVRSAANSGSDLLPTAGVGVAEGATGLSKGRLKSPAEEVAVAATIRTGGSC